MGNRLPPQPGEWVDRARSIEFRFEGEEFEGFAGDTVSSALLANGIRMLGRSFKYHRPRGVFGFADVDCNAMVESQDATNIRADLAPIHEGLDVRAVNTKGGLKGDWLRVLNRFGAFTPVGFYYKAFHTPRALFSFYENRLRAVAGLGSIRETNAFEATPKDYAFCDLLVVGAGPAGMSAALAAADTGARVILVDENFRGGGSLTYAEVDAKAALAMAGEWLRRIEAHPAISWRPGTQAAGYYADHWVALVDENHLTRVRAGAVVFATGGWEQPAVFHNNDLPGVCLASGVLRLLCRYSVRPFSRTVVLAANEDAYRAALVFQRSEIEVAAVVDMRPAGETGPLRKEVSREGIKVMEGTGVYEAIGGPNGQGVCGLRLCEVSESGAPSGDPGPRIDCDGLAMSVGFAPADTLLRTAGVKMQYVADLEQFLPVDCPPGIFAAGSVNGVFGLHQRAADGRHAGLEASAYLGIGNESPGVRPPRAGSGKSHSYPVASHPKGKNFVDLDEDLTLVDFENAYKEGYDSPELLKRYTTVGMGPSQGKHSNLLALRILSRARGESMAGRELTTARPFTSPVSLRHLAGRVFTPRRHTPIDRRHTQLEAEFMYAGNWLRPKYYRDGEMKREDCIAREVAAVRGAVGLIDISTLGKIEVFGPGAADFLDRVYTGRFADLKIGRTRYAAMCDESGVLVDDGLVARFADDHFYVSTTTAGSDAIYRQMQRYAIEWDYGVTLHNLTSHFAAFNIAGPRARELLQSLGELDLSPEGFPFLGCRCAGIAGVPCRLLRVGFVGELGFEIHLPADRARFLWDALEVAGGRFALRPFGVEAQRLLRLEKGHLIVGQDTDGLTNPFEAGMGWAVRMDKPFFVGQRSLRILARKPRARSLVGITFSSPMDRSLPHENNLVVEGDQIAGRVTSIGRSPTLDRAIGLAYVRPDQTAPGTEIHIKRSDGRMVHATVAETPFYDPANLVQEG